jgi:hypothetical protein
MILVICDKLTIVGDCRGETQNEKRKTKNAKRKRGIGGIGGKRYREETPYAKLTPTSLPLQNPVLFYGCFVA